MADRRPQRTLVHVVLTEFTHVRGRTLAVVAVDEVHARGAVLAEVAGAVVNVLLAVLPSVPCNNNKYC